MTQSLQIQVVGAGAWGTALAIQAAQAGHAVTLCARSPEVAQRLAAERVNAAYLPGAAFPASLVVTHDAAPTLASADLHIIGTPMAGLREALGRLPASASVFWLCKGFEAGTGRLGHEIAREVGPQLRVGVLSGPSFAQEVAAGRPTALVAASRDEALAQLAVAALHSERLRIYTSGDPVGVEVGGAVKNVLAIAVGICDGLGQRADAPLAPGLNARAALITRGLAEMMRLGLALGAQPDTFMGLSGLGDLVLTATGDLSRNRRVGLALAQGRSLPEVLAELGHVAEGVYSAPTVLARAQALAVDMPITAAVVALLAGRLTPWQAVEQLMGRGARAESERP